MAVRVGVISVEIWNASLFAMSDAIEFGLEQSIRILPSQSSVMNPNWRSTFSGLMTVRSMLRRSAIAPSS